jgi:hypothetical protein
MAQYLNEVELKIATTLGITLDNCQKTCNNINNCSNIVRIPTENELLAMIQEEERIRNSSEYIAKCNEVADEINGWLRISAEVQYQVVKAYGFISDIESDIAVNHLRRAQFLYPNNPLFREIPVYVRNNIANKGKFHVGDVVPNISIHHLDDIQQETINLYSIFSKDHMNLLLVSSHT